MGAMKSLIMEIEERVLDGVPFYDIAAEFDIEVEQVNEIALAMYEDQPELDAWHRELAAEQAADNSYDHLERDHDEEYIPDPDSWYEAQYDLGDF